MPGYHLRGIKLKSMENINEALTLLAIGMIMVFLILTLVVGVGNLVIGITNRYIRETPPPVKGGDRGKSIQPRKLAVITAVVDVITRGSGRVDSVQKQ